jgi:tRNA(fMet)-specific endonuclease VapC
MKNNPRSVRERFDQLEPGSLIVSVITQFELHYGIAKSQQAQRSQAQLEEFLRLVPAVPLASDAAEIAGKLRAHLESKGTPIGPNDLLIAAHALALDVTLVTNNVREFSRVPDLKLENWAE